MRKFRYPSVEEVQAMERAARRARAEELARIGKAALAGVKSLFVRPAGGVSLKGPRHA
jgi:hypothetical protein